MYSELEQQTQPISVHDYWRVLVRRRWWLLTSLFLCWLVAWGVSWLMPAVYRSESSILIEQQKVPEQYVVANVAIDLNERLQSMTQQILSRNRLQRIIDQYHLYANVRQRMGPDGPVDAMRKDIEIKIVQAKQGDLTGFKIAYSAPSAQIAQQVATQLTSLFIDENLQTQTQQAESTTEFLSNEMETSRAHLAMQEERVREFKAKYLGELPTQMQTNVQILNGLQERYHALNLTLNRAQEQRLYLESLLGQYKSVKYSTDKGTLTTLPALEQELARLRTSLTDAQTRYTPQHPDVIRLQSQIAKTEKLKREIETDLAKNGTKSENAVPRTQADLQMMSPIMQLEGQLKANAQEINDAKRELKLLEAEISRYQARLNVMPVREQQLADLTRDYDQSRSNYDSLLKKQMQSQLATNLEKRQQGRQFRIIDPPSLPHKPMSPDRVKFAFMGLVAGIGLGGALTGLLEYLDDCVRSSRDLRFVSARVLVGIPQLTTPRDESRRMRRRIAEWCLATVIVAFMVAGNVLSFYKG